jgi:hypothetical protein
MWRRRALGGYAGVASSRRRERHPQLAAPPTEPENSANLPPPRQCPTTVTSRSAAAVVPPKIAASCRRMVPPPMKRAPMQIPSGKRMRSLTTTKSDERPAVGRRRLTWIVAIDFRPATIMRSGRTAMSVLPIPITAFPFREAVRSENRENRWYAPSPGY